MNLLEKRLEEYYNNAKSTSEKLGSLKEYDRAKREARDAKARVGDNLLIKAHELFLEGLIEYYIEHIAPGKQKGTEEERILAWSVGELIKNYDDVLRQRRELKKIRETKPDIDSYPKEMHDMQKKEILYEANVNDKDGVYLIVPKLPHAGKRNLGDGRSAIMSWPQEEFLGKTVYAAKPYRDSVLTDVNKVKKYLRMMGAEVLEQKTDKHGQPAEIVIVPKVNSEMENNYPKSYLIPYDEFAKMLDEYLPEMIPSDIKNEIRLMWVVRPDETLPTQVTENKEFYNLKRVMEDVFAPEIKGMNLPRGVEKILAGNIESLIKDVADFYIPAGSNTIIYKLRHSRL